MHRLWKHKWLIGVVVALVALGAGVASWARVAGDAEAAARSAPVGWTSVVGLNGPRSGGLAASVIGEAALVPGGDLQYIRKMCGRWNDQVERWKDRAQQWKDRAERWKTFPDQLRQRMTPADQALYDELRERVKTQREELQRARDNLRDTLRQLRELIDKYLDSASSTSGSQA